MNKLLTKIATLQTKLTEAKTRIDELNKGYRAMHTEASDFKARIDAAVRILQRNSWEPYSVDSVVKALTGETGKVGET